MYNVIWRSNGTSGRIIRRRSGEGHRHVYTTHRPRTCPSSFTSWQDTFSRHVETYRRDRYVELIADVLKGLAARDAFCCSTKFFVWSSYTTVYWTCNIIYLLCLKNWFVAQQTTLTFIYFQTQINSRYIRQMFWSPCGHLLEEDETKRN